MSTDPNPRRARWLKPTLALVGLGLLVAAFAAIGPRAVLEAMRRISAGAIAGAAACLVLSTLLGAWNVHRIAELGRTMRLREFLPVFWRSWAIGISLPGQVADLVTTLWQLSGHRVDLAFVGGRLLVDKAITLGMTLVLATLIPWVLLRGDTRTSIALLVALIAMAAIAYAASRWLVARPHYFGPRTQRLRRVLEAAHLPPGLALINATITAIKMAVTGLAYWIVFSSIEADAPDYVAISVVSLSAGLVAYLPISFNGIGTVELSAVAMFREIGLSSATVLSGYLILRALTLTIAWVPVVWWSARRPWGGAGNT